MRSPPDTERTVQSEPEAWRPPPSPQHSLEEGDYGHAHEHAWNLLGKCKD